MVNAERRAARGDPAGATSAMDDASGEERAVAGESGARPVTETPGGPEPGRGAEPGPGSGASVGAGADAGAGATARGGAEGTGGVEGTGDPEGTGGAEGTDGAEGTGDPEGTRGAAVEEGGHAEARGAAGKSGEANVTGESAEPEAVGEPGELEATGTSGGAEAAGTSGESGDTGEAERSGDTGESRETGDPGDAREDAAADNLETLRTRLEAARREADGEREAALRARAEAENVRRRAARDVEQAHRFGIEGLVRELLPVRDGLELGSRAGEEEGSSVETLLEGTAMTLRMLSAALEKFGAVEVDPAGEDFDPRFHQAMSIQEAEGVESGKVIQVFQKGCLLHGRVVRPAMVIVSK